MNRLVITILLVLAFAVSFARFAFATPATPKISHPNAKTAPADSAAPAPADTAAKVDSASTSTPTTPSIADICGTDTDCISKKLSDGKEIVNSVESSDGASSLVGTVKTESCHCDFASIAPQKIAIPKSSKPEDLKVIAQQLDDKLKEAFNTFNAEKTANAHKKFLLDTCQYDVGTDFKMVDGSAQWTYVKFKKPKITKVSKDPEDFSTIDDTPELDPVRTCQEESIKRLEDSTDEKDMAAVSVLVKKFDKRLAELHAKAALGTMTGADLEEYKNMNDFQSEVIAANPTMSEVSANFFYDNVQKEQADLKAKLGFAYSNPGQAAGILAALNKTVAVQYASDIQLAAGNMGNLNQNDTDYATKVAFLNGLSKDPSDLLNTVKKMSDALPASAKVAAGDGTFSNFLNQLKAADGTTDKASVEKSFDQNLKIAGKIAERCENGDCGGLNASVFLKEPASAQCFAAGNCTGLNSAPHWKLGTGQVASQSATNYTSATQMAAGSNLITRTSPNGFSAGRNM